jgi:glycosyltransferase involved in cell wall biosynthesis
MTRSPKRLLLVNAEGAAVSAGGAETIVAMLARGLAERGWEIAVLAAFPTDDPPETGSLVTLHRTSWRSSRRRRALNHVGDVVASAAPRLVDAVRDARPDVVHTHNLPGLSTAVWSAAALAGARVVHTLHDYYLLCPRVSLLSRSGRPCGRGAFCTFRSRRLQRWSHAVDDVVGVSRTLLEHHAGFFPNAREHVIRHPSPPRVPPAGLPASTPRTIGFLGTLDVTKGVHVLLDAAPRLVELGFELRIAGSGRLRPAVEAAAEGRPGIVYAGRVSGESRDSFLAECDIGIVPSVWDEPGGPPLVLLDWLSAGRPVLSSGRGGLSELEGARGVVEIEPTPDAIVRAAAAVRRPDAWRELAGEVRPPILPSAAEWLEAYERVLQGEP